MKIISHRGLWLKLTEKNTMTAFARSFRLGFGTETDIRDSAGQLVISHDLPFGGELSFKDFISTAAQYSNLKTPLLIGLNIKADGLANIIIESLSNFPHLDCFVFDMAVPDMRHYLRAGIKVFTRMSEVERNPAFIDQADGVWLDGFFSEWYDNATIENLLAIGKRVCLVSPELHGRPHLEHWKKLRTLVDSDQVILCTDLPVEAYEFF